MMPTMGSPSRETYLRNPTGLDRMEVLHLIQFYQDLVRQSSLAAASRALLIPGRHPENLKIWEPFCEILRFCRGHQINPFSFIRAQFAEWSKPNPYAANYPTSHYLGVNHGCVRRYKAWCRKAKDAKAAKEAKVDLKLGAEIMTTLLKNRPDLRTRDDVFADPYLIRMLPKEYVRAQPEFIRVEATLRQDPYKRVILSDYLA